MKLKNLAFVAIAGLALSATLPGKAQAVPMLSISDGTTTVEVVDNGIGDNNADVGIVSYDGIIGTNWEIITELGIAVGAPGVPMYHLSSHTTSLGSTVPSDLTIRFTETDWVPLASITGVKSLVGGVTGSGGEQTFTTYYGGDNSPYGTSNILADHGTFGSGAFSDTLQGDIVGLPTPASFTLEAVVTHPASPAIFGNLLPVTSSFDYAITPVPEPSSVMLMMGGLLGIATIIRRRKTS